MNRSGTRSRPARTGELVARARKRAVRWNKAHGPELLYTFTMPATRSVSSPLDGRFRLVEADLEMIDELKARHPDLLSDAKHEILRQRQRQTTERCYVIADDGSGMYGYAHMALSDHVNARINHLVRVREDQVYLFDDHIFKPHRRQGLHAFCIAARLRIAASLGRTEAITIISRGNAASIASYRKFGARRTSTLVYVRQVRRTLVLPARDDGGRRAERSPS